jgi:hypothetical protein
MPDNPIQWLWFIFYTGGALGGWFMWVVAAHHLITESNKDG